MDVIIIMNHVSSDMFVLQISFISQNVMFSQPVTFMPPIANVMAERLHSQFIHNAVFWPCAKCTEILHNPVGVQGFASQLSTGKSKWAVAVKCLIRLGCLEQRPAVYLGTSIYQLPVAHEFYAAQPTCKALYALLG